jgi:hypothetical protein
MNVVKVGVGFGVGVGGEIVGEFVFCGFYHRFIINLCIIDGNYNN